MVDDMREFDVVALCRDVPDEGLQAGQIGTIVFVHEEGKAFEVEFIIEPRRSVIMTLPAEALLRLKGLNYRRVAV